MKYLITYDNDRVVTVIEEPGEGANILSGSNYLIDTLPNAGLMLTAIGIDTAEIDRYKELNPSWES